MSFFLDSHCGCVYVSEETKKHAPGIFVQQNVVDEHVTIPFPPLGETRRHYTQIADGESAPTINYRLNRMDGLDSMKLPSHTITV